MRGKINIKCSICEKEFLRSQSEVYRNQRQGRRVFCSRSCAGKALVENINKKSIVWEHLRKYKPTKIDEFSAFRSHLRSARLHALNRGDDRGFEITLQDLKNQWEKQNGKYEGTTYTQTREQVLKFGAGLVSLGLQKGDRVGLISEGRNAWIIGELGILHAGAVNVPLSIKLEESNDLIFR